MKQKFCETVDLALGRYLKLHGFLIRDIRRKDGWAVFVFEDRPVREEPIMELDNDIARVSRRNFGTTSVM